MPEGASRLFVGFRALGFVSNHVPLCVRYHQKHRENYAVTCVGRAFHVYNCSKLGITIVSNTVEEPITCMAVDARFIYVGSGKIIYAFIQGRKIRYRYVGHDDTIVSLLPFANHLVSVDEKSCIKVWNIETEDVFLDIPFDNATFRVTALLHPHTYVNKILIGSAQGSLKLWNLRKNQIIYSFSGWESQVTVLEQSPACDVVAVGLADGRILLHNLKHDETVMTFKQDWGLVTAISFRTDGRPLMLTGSTLGHIAVWNLEERKLHSQIRQAHNSPVTGLHCLPSEPLMVTSGPDNALKVWIFDQVDGGGRLLNQRSGHSSPPNRLLYHGTDGLALLSAGQDSTLRMFSTKHESYDRSLGRASYDKAKSKRAGLVLDEHMMPPITDFASETTRQSDWDGIVACHRGERVVTTWSINRFTMGSHRLQHQRFTSKQHNTAVAQCVTITACGNFAVIGYNSGHVDMYNMQSGQYRGSYGKDKAHDGSVLGVAIDALNLNTVTAGTDCSLKFWRFKCFPITATASTAPTTKSVTAATKGAPNIIAAATAAAATVSSAAADAANAEATDRSKAVTAGSKRDPIEVVKLESVICKIRMHRESSLLAVALDDCRLLIFDVDTRRVIRRFAGHSNTVTDLTFSSDGRWLFSASMDSTIKTWDIPSGRLIDCFLVPSPATSITMSPVGTYLATSHVDDLGIYLWANMSLYSPLSVTSSLRPLPADYQPSLLHLPSTSHRGPQMSDNLVDDKLDEDEEEGIDTYKSPEQISEELVTLSMLPSSRWHSLLYLDVIKKRNKPKEPPKAIKVPFFIPTIPGLEPKFGLPASEEGTEAKKQDEDSKFNSLFGSYSEFGQQLEKLSETNDVEGLMTRLKSMGPSATDVEIRCLSPDAGGSVELLSAFMKLLIAVFERRKDFELAEGYLALFLKLHTDVISSHSDLLITVGMLRDAHVTAWRRVSSRLSQSLSLVTYLRGAIL